MSGRRHVMDPTGGIYEDYVRLHVGCIASIVQIPQEKDFGIECSCQPRIPIGLRTEMVAEFGFLQVKGGQADLTYGGVNKSGEWREYQF